MVELLQFGSARRDWGARAMVSAPSTSRFLIESVPTSFIGFSYPLFRERAQDWLTGDRFFCGRISTEVTDQSQQDITGMLAAWNAGDADALDRLIDLVYPKLRQIARHHLERRRDGESLESAALANEAYLKLVRA